MRHIVANLISYIKKFFKNRINAIIVVIVLVVLIVIFLVSSISANKRKSMLSGNEYDMYSSEVERVYANMNDVSCNGALYFKIEADKGPAMVSYIDKNNLLDYLFSNLDKNGELTDKFSKSLITKTEKELFVDKLNLVKEIKNYQYGDYVYNKRGTKIVRKKQECVSSNNYVSYLYGYSLDKNELHMDVNFGYVKEEVLYDLNNKNIGKYDKNENVANLFDNSPYYHFVYVKKGGLFKLKSIELINKV